MPLVSLQELISFEAAVDTLGRGLNAIDQLMVADWHLDRTLTSIEFRCSILQMIPGTRNAVFTCFITIKRTGSTYC